MTNPPALAWRFCRVSLTPSSTTAEGGIWGIYSSWQTEIRRIASTWGESFPNGREDWLAMQASRVTSRSRVV